MRQRSVDWVGRVTYPPTLATVLILSVVGLLLRASLLWAAAWVEAENADVQLFREWLELIRANGGLSAFGLEIGNYTPAIPYLFLIGDHLLVGAPDIVVIKYAAIVADFVAAAFAYRIVRLNFPNGRQPVLAFGVVLLAPTVILNSAVWGQTDMVWTAAIVGALFFVLTGRSLVALVLVGIAFAVKQQAEFIFPFFVLLALKRVFPWRYFLVIPAVYALLALPAWLAGRSAWDLATIYVGQAGTYTRLTLEAPTLYQWLPESHADVLGPLGATIGLAILGFLVVLAARSIQELTPPVLLALATASVLVTPFLLPRMHERYFFAADVLSIVLAFYVRRLVVVAVIVQLVSLASYSPFLVHRELVPGEFLSALELTAILILLRWISSTMPLATRVRQEPYPAPDDAGVEAAP